MKGNEDRAATVISAMIGIPFAIVLIIWTAWIKIPKARSPKIWDKGRGHVKVKFIITTVITSTLMLTACSQLSTRTVEQQAEDLAIKACAITEVTEKDTGELALHLLLALSTVTPNQDLLTSTTFPHEPFSTFLIMKGPA